MERKYMGNSWTPEAVARHNAGGYNNLSTKAKEPDNSLFKNLQWI
jgi:hypothetical protein